MTNLRFGGYQFAHNPRKLTVKYLKNTAESICMGFGAALQELGPGLTVVEGEGELFGADAMEQFQQLRRVFLQQGSETLSGAGLEPMRAVFRELILLGRGGEQALTYRLRFVEERRGG